MVESASDRLSMLSDFGVTVEWSGVDFIGIFDNNYHAAEFGGSVAFATSQPKLTCRTADITSVTVGTTLTIEAVDYTVQVVMNDGTGVTELTLETV